MQRRSLIRKVAADPFTKRATFCLKMAAINQVLLKIKTPTMGKCETGVQARLLRPSQQNPPHPLSENGQGTVQ